MIVEKEKTPIPSNEECNALTEELNVIDKTKGDDEIKKVVGYCYEDILNVLRTYCDLKEEYYNIIALWIIGTYIHESFETFPYLFINAMRGSGKTRLLKLISSLSYKSKGRVQTGITESVLFRKDKGETLILDELESIGSKDKSQLREYLNVCYKKGATIARSKKVKNMDGEDYVVQEFEPYKPIAMANIWGMEEVLGDRCITLILEKSNKPHIIKLIEDFKHSNKINSIIERLNKNQCSLCSVVTEKNIYKAWNNYILGKYNNNTTTLTTITTYNCTNYTTLKEMDISRLFNKIDGTNIDGRNLELSIPLFIIAHFLNDDVLNNTLISMSDLVKERKTEEMLESKDVLLIEFISEQHNPEFIRVKDITKLFRLYLNEDEEEDKWLNSKWVGRALKRLRLIKERRRTSKGIEVKMNCGKAEKSIQWFKPTPEDKEVSIGNDGVTAE